MGKMSDDEKRDWTLMSGTPPDEWDEAHYERLLEHGRRIAKRYGAVDQVDDVVQNVILRMIKNRAWWNNPKNPEAFERYMYQAFKNETFSFHRDDKRDRETGATFDTSHRHEGDTGSRAEPMDPRPAVDPEEVAIQNEERQYKLARLSGILGEFVSTLDKPGDNVDMATYEIFKKQAGFSASPRGGEEKNVEYLEHLVGLLYNPRSPRNCGLESTGELIRAYVAAAPTLTSVAARKRITRLRKKFSPFKKRTELVCVSLGS